MYMIKQTDIMGGKTHSTHAQVPVLNRKACKFICAWHIVKATSNCTVSTLIVLYCPPNLV